jgi:hypothetical protein
MVILLGRVVCRRCKEEEWRESSRDEEMDMVA